MKVIGYVRVSTEGQATEGVSLEAQEKKIRAWAELKGVSDIVIPKTFRCPKIPQVIL